MEQVHHAIDYVEISVLDLAAAKDFYRAAFGWTFTDYGPDYAGITDTPGAGEVGGLARAGDVPRGGSPFVLLYSDDLDASREAVIAAGGTAEEPYDFPGGRRFHFTDPSGNELGVWSPA